MQFTKTRPNAKSDLRGLKEQNVMSFISLDRDECLIQNVVSAQLSAYISHSELLDALALKYPNVKDSKSFQLKTRTDRIVFWAPSAIPENFYGELIGIRTHTRRREKNTRPSIRPATCTDIKIAIMCSLAIEADAIEALLDGFWDTDEVEHGKAQGDHNSYTLGYMGSHNVVLAYMPGLGKVRSASVAAGFSLSFPGIELALLVGICGGVPQSNTRSDQIFLGDVVVSTGRIQIDHGGMQSESIYQSFDPPNEELGSFVNAFQNPHHLTGLQKELMHYVSEVTERKEFLDWSFPGRDLDQLYRASYLHKHHDSNRGSECAEHPNCEECSKSEALVCDTALWSTCAQLECDPAQLVTRYQSTQVAGPKVHFGRFASVDSVIRSAATRERHAEKDIIAFEMESAEVWDKIPTIIIKGVCDYCDNHRNKRWRKYAAITAAACAKTMLKDWHCVDS